MSGMVLSVIVLGVYFFFRGGAIVETKYVLAAVEKGTIVASITGSGQVSALQQIDVKPKVSGNITYVGVKAGQQVYQGQVLAYLDSKDAQRSIRDAQISLESVKLSLAKIKLNQESGSTDLNQSIKDAQLVLDQTYLNAFNAVSTTFLEIPSILSGMEDVFLQNNLEPGNSNVNAYGNMVSSDTKTEVQGMVNNIIKEYNTVKAQYQRNFDNYKNTSRSSEPTVTEALLKETLATVEAMDDLIKHEQNMLDTVVLDLRTNGSRSVPSIITNYQSNIGQYLNTLNSSVTSLTNISNSFDTKRQAIVKAEQSLTITNQSNPIDVATQENTVAQREAALQDAQENLANYAIRAPFASIVAKSDVKVGDSASSSTIIATLLTKQTVAQISLNEVDIAQVKVNQKVTLTFDAVEDLTLTGQVVEVDSLGTVSQGVVTYSIKIGFDTQDERIKSGMSVSAAIITDSRQNVLMIPNSAVKSANTGSYIETPGVALDTQTLANISNSTGISLPSPTQRQTIETGLSNDTMIEVISGLKEGDLVVVRTVTSSATTSTTQNNSLFPSGGRTTGTGGGARTGGF